MAKQSEELRLEIEPIGPPQEALDAVGQAAASNSTLNSMLANARYRILSVAPVESDDKTEEPVAPSQIRATIYDYTNNRTLFAQAGADNPENVEVTESGIQPLPSAEEFDEAVSLLLQDEKIGPDLRSNRLVAYRPMPPLLPTELPDGRIERTLAVGLYDEYVGHRIFGVNMVRQAIIHEPGDTPHDHDDCGPAPAGGCESRNGTQRVKVSVWQGSTLLWTFVAVRPTTSSGTNGSGIELQHVNYRGKQVLYRAHVPILNIEYYQEGQQVGCGPTYRDWQNSENCFEAIGTDVGSGFRLCSTPARSILDSNSDSGNFSGVAIYVQGQEVVLVTELEAGWYRYICMWRLHADGTIRPRWGFGATNNPCTCKPHHHHAYWRFDFDIQTAGNNLVQEYNDPPLIGTSKWHTKTFEIRRPRDAARHRKWRVTNARSGSGYELIPGVNDGNADSYGVGDVWVVRYHFNEIDDGHPFSTNPAVSRADIDKFVNGESVTNQDVVLWYAGHFLHTPTHGGLHIVGPDLKPFNW